MISFLRKVRKSLLNTGSTKKYLLYAFGEITLVVIGILIALQINNWNVDNKERTAEKYFLNQMLIELEADILTLESEKEKLQSQLEPIRDLLEDLNKEESTKEQFNPIMIEYLHKALYPYSFKTNSATFDEMKSTGQIGVIDDNDLRNEIVQLYNNLNDMELTFVEANTFTRELSIDLSIRSQFAKYLNYNKSTYSKYNSSEELFQMRKHKKTILNHVLNQNWSIFDYTPILDRQIAELKDITQKIRGHLST